MLGIRTAESVVQMEERIMSDKDTANLRKKHPNLHRDMTKGHLVEANAEFAKVAAKYPVEASP